MLARSSPAQLPPSNRCPPPLLLTSPRRNALLCTFSLCPVTIRFLLEGVADVYIDNRSRVWLLDINPFSAVTDSLLFDWSEDALAAPLPPPKRTTQQGEDEEALPPDVFMRIHFDPSPPSTGAEGENQPPQTPEEAAVKNSASILEQEQKQQHNADGDEGEGSCRETSSTSIFAGATGVTFAAGTGERDFELRCVPSSLHMVPDPMGRYRGPADVGMGTLTGGMGGEGGLELEDLIETCRLAAKDA